MNLPRPSHFLLAPLMMIGCLVNSVEAQHWQKFYERPEYGSALDGQLSLTADHGLLFFNTYSSPNENSSTIFKLDSDGDLQWEEYLTDSRIHILHPVNDSSFLILGSSGAPEDSKLQVSTMSIDGRFELRSERDFSLPVRQIAPVPDGGFAVATAGDTTFFELAILDEDGNFLRLRSFPFNGSVHIDRLIPDSQQEVIVAATLLPFDGVPQRLLLKYNFIGEERWRRTGNTFSNIYPGIPGNYFYGVSAHEITTISSDGEVLARRDISLGQTSLSEMQILQFQPIPAGYLIGGSITRSESTASYDSDLFVARLDQNFTPVNFHSFGRFAFTESFLQTVYAPGTGWTLLGTVPASAGLNSDLRHSFLLRADEEGQWPNGLISGNVMQDLNDDCQTNPPDQPLSQWLVTAKNEQIQYYARTDSNGGFQIDATLGDYQVEILRPNIYWESCDSLLPIEIGQPFDTVVTAHPTQVRYECPLIKVDVSTTYLDRCRENTYIITYCNEGTVPAEDAQLFVFVDRYLAIGSSAPAWAERNGQNLRFDVGPLAVGECGTIQLPTTLDCNTPLAGQSHCVEVRAFPDTLCSPPGINWDGSSLAVSGSCLGDSLEFRIRNIGRNPMNQPSQYIIVENDVVYFGGRVQLDAGGEEVIMTFASGKTFRLEVEQAPGHPGRSSPSVVVEGCRAENQAVDIGYVISHPFDEGDAFVAIDCQESLTTEPPAPISSFPRGVGAQHLIDPNQDIEYKIYFRNPFPYPVEQVVVRDSLPPELDPATIVPGSSSHPYRLHISPSGLLKFSFDQLGASFDEDPGEGFLQFKISQRPDLPPGTIIRNKASIVYQHNLPRATNTTFHTVRKPIRFVTLDRKPTCSPDILEATELMGVDTISKAEYDCVVVWNAWQYPSHTTLPDSLEQAGELQYLTNRYGCDSLGFVTVTTSNPVLSPPQFGTFHVFPNPSFGQDIQLHLELYERTALTIDLLSPAGKQVETWVEKSSFQAGKHLLQRRASLLPTGLYLIRLRVGRESIVRRFILLDQN